MREGSLDIYRCNKSGNKNGERRRLDERSKVS